MTAAWLEARWMTLSRPRRLLPGSCCCNSRERAAVWKEQQGQQRVKLFLQLVYHLLYVGIQARERKMPDWDVYEDAPLGVQFKFLQFRYSSEECVYTQTSPGTDYGGGLKQERSRRQHARAAGKPCSPRSANGTRAIGLVQRLSSK
jgi:hypothetical protein